MRPSTALYAPVLISSLTRGRYYPSNSAASVCLSLSRPRYVIVTHLEPFFYDLVATLATLIPFLYRNKPHSPQVVSGCLGLSVELGTLRRKRDLCLPTFLLSGPDSYRADKLDSGKCNTDFDHRQTLLTPRLRAEMMHGVGLSQFIEKAWS